MIAEAVQAEILRIEAEQVNEPPALVGPIDALDRILQLETALRDVLDVVDRIGGYMVHADQVAIWRAQDLVPK